MKIIIAPDSFKGNMRAATVCDIIRRAFLQEMPNAEIITLPMADGGEGTVEAVVESTGGTLHSVTVTGPLGDPVEAQYGLLPDGTAIMEMASASGIELISTDQLNPMNTSTFGTGELLKHLLQTGHTHIVMGIGGSATVDGGTGMAQALGYRFLDAAGRETSCRGGQILSAIKTIHATDALPELKSATLQVACDVTTPLTGPHGAAAIFGPQKGATSKMIGSLDAGLSNLQKICKTSEAPGDGAAGGLGYGLRAFCNAKIVSGAKLIAEIADLPKLLKKADLLITGEGRTDEQTASGKLCAVLADLAREHGTRSLLLSGALAGTPDSFLKTFDYAFSISTGHASLKENIRNAPADLAFTARNIARLLPSTPEAL